MAAGLSVALTACGGGGDATPSAQAAVSGATHAASIEIDADVVGAQAQPTFHVAPVILDAPDGADALDNTASTRRAAHEQSVPAEFAGLGTSRLTVQALDAASRSRALGAPASGGEGGVKAQAAAGTVVTYTPAQVRAAYGLPALPVAGATLTAAQAAQLGAGQTIYIVDAKHDPNALAELNAFNQNFGLPACVAQPVAVAAKLPLAAASASAGCVLSVVYSTASAGMTATAPAYDAGWATEIALDVQWAHAIAPLARLVLIEAPDAQTTSLLAAVKLANAMGPGVVSMSFGAPESGAYASLDTTFATTGMTYLAATGDAGAQVLWPSVSPNVLAVGGTTLRYAAGSPRSETAWSNTGGGISAYTARPAYQANTVPGMGTPARRAVADVSFNADPYSGQYLALIAPGTTAPRWVSGGGTSLSTPQWAGLVAIANAMRALSAKPALGAAHTALYGQIASVPGTYAAAFADVASGANGGCATCAGKLGYDVPTGLGTPNATGLLSALTGATQAPTTPVPPAPAQPPVITASALAGTAGKPLSGSITVSDPGNYAMNISISGIPGGMTLAPSGKTLAIAWTSPVAGAYTLVIVARDSIGLSTQVSVPVTIAKAK